MYARLVYSPSALEVGRRKKPYHFYMPQYRRFGLFNFFSMAKQSKMNLAIFAAIYMKNRTSALRLYRYEFILGLLHSSQVISC